MVAAAHDISAETCLLEANAGDAGAQAPCEALAYRMLGACPLPALAYRA